MSENINSIIEELKDIAYHPNHQLEAYKDEGKKVIGCMPYYVPEELIYASGAVPMGIWGTNNRTISLAKEYCASFYCTIAQLSIEMLMDGTLNGLDGIVTPTPCDTLRPMSQNIKAYLEKSNSHIVPIFLAQPQRRTDEAGRDFCLHQYGFVKTKVEEITGVTITDEALRETIKIYNQSRKERRRFVRLAGLHPEAISAVDRSAVLKASYFLSKDVYTEKLANLNDHLERLPNSGWSGVKIMTSGIVCDNPKLLKIFDDNHIAIVADDIAHESRSFSTDAPEDTEGMQALVDQWAKVTCDPIYWDKDSREHTRAKALIRKVRKSGAQGVVFFMMQFCDPEEADYPHLKHDLEIADIPHIRLGIDQQMHKFGQIETSLQAFADVLEIH